ncbi:hypothetical protein PUN28_000518 [Cardiocondyla obscurior]|uniref:IFT140 second beta-propeller domain-containing protein n=1 Tax=Cardiocondyla obscurior TaxID=286306 RepID=A0AAW2H0C1_9HYME
MINDFAEVIEARCNLDCHCVSITVAMANLMPSSVLYVWDIESDQIHEMDFGESDDIADDDSKLAAHHDSKIFIKENDQIAQASVVLVSLFVTSDHGIVIQDVKPIADENCRLLGVHSPHIVILNSEKSVDKSSKIVQLLMRDFEELGECDCYQKSSNGL